MTEKKRARKVKNKPRPAETVLKLLRRARAIAWKQWPTGPGCGSITHGWGEVWVHIVGAELATEKIEESTKKT